MTAPSAFYAANGRSPRVADLTASDQLPSPSTIACLFGSFNSGLVAAGLSLNHVGEHHRHWSDAEILEAIRQAAQDGEPTSQGFRTGRRKP